MKKHLWIIWVSIIAGILGGLQGGIRSATEASTTGGAIFLFLMEEFTSIFAWAIIGAIVFAIVVGINKEKNKSIGK